MIIDRQKFLRTGFTLAEMMVAVSITVVMLLIVGLVFSSSIKASGIGASSNEVMGQLRTVTGQLEKDFSGWRNDMPMAMIFEGYYNDPDDASKLVHYDRICGFANGDFQDMQGTASGNVARIFYGQMDIDITRPLEPISNVAPPRRILSRRYKILTASDPMRVDIPLFSSIPLNLSNWPIPITPESYDDHLFEEASVQLWRNGFFTDYENNFFRTDLAAIESFVRAPHYHNIIATGDDQWLQQLYFMADVTNFKIQIWVKEEIFGFPGEYKGRWFPTDGDMENFWDYEHNSLDRKFAIYWNTPPLAAYMNDPSDIPWFPPAACNLANLASPSGLGLNVSQVPAVKFTFTIYDRGRKNFPQGQTFEYIVKLGQ